MKPTSVLRLLAYLSPVPPCPSCDPKPGWKQPMPLRFKACAALRLGVHNICSSVALDMHRRQLTLATSLATSKLTFPCPKLILIAW